MSQRIIIPKGTIDPNETSVVEVPHHLQNSQVVIASPRGHQQQQHCQPGTSSTMGPPAFHSTPATSRQPPRPHSAGHHLSPQQRSHDESSSYYTCYGDSTGQSVSNPSSLVSQRSFSPAAPYKPERRHRHVIDMAQQRHEKTYPPAKTKGERRRDRDRWMGHRQDEGVAQLQRHMGIEEPSPPRVYGPEPFKPHRIDTPDTSKIRKMPYPGPYTQRSQTGFVNWNKFKVVRKVKKAADKMKKIKKIEAAEQNQLKDDLKNFQSARKKFIRDTHDICALM